jgi:HD-GYP domain-containing protein (c-di-GMP phosphodiesterase class II)
VSWGEEISCSSEWFNLYFLDIGVEKDDVDRDETIMSQPPQHRGEIRHLQDQFVDLLTSLSETIDARDPNSQGHSRRVARYSLAIGGRLGFPHHRLERLKIAAPIHDIGKLGVEAFDEPFEKGQISLDCSGDD